MADLTSQTLLAEIAAFCRGQGLAETTFGKVAINDGKLVSRLRNGGRITTVTHERIRAFMADRPSGNDASQPVLIAAKSYGKAAGQVALAAKVSRLGGDAKTGPASPLGAKPGAIGAPTDPTDPQRNFRFFDNRQKYLTFVNTCSEKWVVGHRVALELANVHPKPPAMRVFDAGVGDGSVLARVMRTMHARSPSMPFYIVGKEISLEDVRLTLQKMADRFFEHPATVLVLTNLSYQDAPGLAVRSVSAASSLVWHELKLAGSSSHDFEEEIGGLQGFLSENWRASVSPRTGNPVYERPAVLVIYRGDHGFLLDPIIPRPGGTSARYDLVIASQPYRARASVEFKAKRVLAPLARALGPGGRLIGIHSYGHDPGMDIIHRIWPDDNPFTTDRHTLLKATKQELGTAARDLNFNAYSDQRALFRYDMHTLPTELAGSIGTSTLFAAWNAAIYVAQIEDDRISAVIGNSAYLEATQAVLHQHGGLWFNNESFVISRRRD